MNARLGRYTFFLHMLKPTRCQRQTFVVMQKENAKVYNIHIGVRIGCKREACARIIRALKCSIDAQDA